MLTPEHIRNLVKVKFNREEICQNCEIWICIKNCKECLFNILSDYKIPDSDRI